MFIPTPKVDFKNETTFYVQYLLDVLSNFQARQDEEFAFVFIQEFLRCEKYCYELRAK